MPYRSAVREHDVVDSLSRGQAADGRVQPHGLVVAGAQHRRAAQRVSPALGAGDAPVRAPQRRAGNIT